jgi:hypothetical protein
LPLFSFLGLILVFTAHRRPNQHPEWLKSAEGSRRRHCLRKGVCFVVMDNLVPTVSENPSFVSRLVVRCLVSRVSRLLCLVSCRVVVSHVVSCRRLSSRLVLTLHPLLAYCILYCIM